MATAKVPIINCMMRSSPPSPTKSLRSSFVKIPSSLGSVKPMTKTSGLKSQSGFRATAIATYKIKFISPDGTETEFDAPDDAYLLDSAESAGLQHLPYSCRAGACSTCTAKLVSGRVDQSDGSFLDADQMETGYLLTCVSYPNSDCVVHTHKGSDLF